MPVPLKHCSKQPEFEQKQMDNTNFTSKVEQRKIQIQVTFNNVTKLSKI